jgi:hypothetical protein
VTRVEAARTPGAGGRQSIDQPIDRSIGQSGRGGMYSDRFYEDFAAEWIAAWNSHDLERVLSHYDESFEFSSPVLARMIPASGGRLEGVEAVRPYWSKALALYPELHFEPIAVLKGVDSLVIHYRGLNGRLCAEFFVLGRSGKVVSSHAHGE